MMIRLHNMIKPPKLARRSGFSLPELSIAILCMMILASVLYLSYDWIRDSAKRSTTIKDMDALVNAVRIYQGHKKDGQFPATLGDLLVGVSAAESVDGVIKGAYIVRKEWTTGDATTWVDGWGQPYVYDRSARTITSTGGVSANAADNVPIIVKF